jgi:Ca-activated chloride channel homolog
VDVSYVPVGTGGKNVAITAFSVRRYPLDKSRYEVMLEVTNTDEQPHEVELTLTGDGAVVDVTRLQVAPKQQLPRFYSDLGGASRKLEAKIRLAGGATDDLPADDHAFALMPERRRSRVLLVTAGNTYLEAALLLDEYLEVTSVAPASYPPSGTFDVTIFDGVAPERAARTGAALYLNPPEAGSPVPLGKRIEDFGFDAWDRKSGLLRWMALENVQVAEGRTFKPAEGDRVVGESALGPILVAGRRDGLPFVALGFDPRRSDFVLRVAWPLFILNSIDSFVEEETGYVSSYRTGDVWRVPVPSGIRQASLEDPSGRRIELPVKEGRASYFGDQAGFYKLRVEGQDEPIEFAANLVDVEESTVAPVSELSIGGKKTAAVQGFSAGIRRELWLYLVLGAIALSLVEWVTYHRRVTV